jgi:energy-coupling factor transporter ATP-binding protein EcfA2
MILNRHRHQSSSAAPLVVQIIPHHASSDEETQSLHTLETLIQTFSASGGIIGLDIAHSAAGPQFLLRATNEMALHQMMRQLHARSPQATIRRLSRGEDPLVLSEGDYATAVELRAGGAAYHSLRSWSSRDWQSPGADPMLSLLAEGVSLPASFRTVAQLALDPLPPGWARKYARLALSHPLEEERTRRREASYRAQRGNAPSWGAIIGLAGVVVLLTAWRYGPLAHYLPSWVLPALGVLLHGHRPQLTPEQRGQLLLVGLMLGVLLAGAAGISHLWVRLLHPGPALYDQRRVAEKLSQSAYRGRLRLYVIETVTHTSTLGALPHDPTGNIPVSGWMSPWLSLWDRGLHRLLERSGIAGQVYRRVVQVRSHWEQWSTRRKQHRDVQAAWVAAYQQYHTSAAYFRARSYAARWVRRWLGGDAEASRWSVGMRWASLYLSTEEVALLWHPLSGEGLAETSWLEQRQERTLLAPHAVTTGQGWKLGTSQQAGMQADVFFPFEALHHHAFVVGRTGKGKSTLFEHLALAQLHTTARPTPGLCVLEPHGDLIAELLSHLPAERADEVTLVDLANQTSPPGLNLLDMSPFWDSQSQGIVEMELLVGATLSTLKSIWMSVGSWGSRIENVLRYALKALALANLTLVRADHEQGPMQQYTLLDVVPLLNLHAFRRRVLDLVDDPFVLEWWNTYYERLDTMHQQDLITPIITKISAYAGSSVARRILGQPCSTIAVEHLVEQGGILLINTAASLVSQDVSSLLGATLLSLFASILARQFGLPVLDRRPFLVLVDEFRNYPVDYGYLLSELRKAGLSLVLAAQSLAQLDKFDPVLRPTVLSNSDHLFTFTLAGEDAALLKKELGQVQPDDVVALPDYTCYAKWSLQGKRLPIFSFRLARPRAGDQATADLIRARSAQRDGRPVAQVDAWMQQVHQFHHPDRPTRGSGKEAKRAAPTSPASGPVAPQQASGPEISAKPKRVRTRNKPEATSGSMGSTTSAGSSQSLLYEEQERAAHHSQGSTPLVQ